MAHFIKINKSIPIDISLPADFSSTLTSAYKNALDAVITSSIPDLSVTVSVTPTVGTVVPPSPPPVEFFGFVDVTGTVFNGLLVDSDGHNLTFQAFLGTTATVVDSAGVNHTGTVVADPSGVIPPPPVQTFSGSILDGGTGTQFSGVFSDPVTGDPVTVAPAVTDTATVKDSAGVLHTGVVTGVDI